MSQKNFIKEVFKILSALSLWQNRGGLVLDWIPFLPQKVKTVFKDSEHHKFYGRIVAHVIWKNEKPSK